MKNKRSLFAVPYVIWMAIFVVIPIIIVLIYSLTVPVETADGEVLQGSLENFTGMALYAGVFGRSFWLAFIATVICLFIGYPVAYLMSREGPGFQRVAMALIMLPMWMNFLLRTYSWMAILENNGLLNQLFAKLGIISLYNRLTGSDIDHFQMIRTSGAVVLGMVYNYLPFMILPIYTVLVKLDNRLIEAAADLGANSATVFRRETLPLSLSGIV